MKHEPLPFCPTILLLTILGVCPVLYAQPSSPTVSTSPSPTASIVNQPSATPEAKPETSPANATPTPPNDQRLISPEMVTALGNLIASLVWWGVILIVCAILIIFRKELRSLVKKAERAETLDIGAPGGVGLRIGKPLDNDKKVEPTLPEERAAPPSKPKDVSEVKGTRETEDQPSERTLGDLRNDLEKAFLTNDEDNIQQALEALQVATTDPDDKIANESIYLHSRFKQGHPTALVKLQKLAASAPAISVPYFHLGLCYEDANEIEKAIEAFRLSIERTKDRIAKAYRVALMARCMQKAGKPLDAYKAVSSAVANAKNLKYF